MWSSRWFALSAAAALIVAVFAASAHAAQPQTHRELKNATSQAIVATWRCQDKIPEPRTRARSPWKPHSIGFRRKQLNLWTAKLNRCRATLARSIPNTGDWVTAVKIVQRVYPGTQDWLLKISSREGGHGGFVMNKQGSGCGGWMQFMESTYWASSYRAYDDLRRRGWRIDPRSNSWTNPMGQAVTAAYMRFTHQDGPHWTATDW